MLTCGDLEMDDDAHQVTKAGVEVSLSPTEYNLLRYLLVNQGRVLSKAQILDHVWQYDFGGDGGVVETYIGYLRRKLDTTEPKLIHDDPRRRLHDPVPGLTVLQAVPPGPLAGRDGRSSSLALVVVALDHHDRRPRRTSSTRSTTGWRVAVRGRGSRVRPRGGADPGGDGCRPAIATSTSAASTAPGC